MSIVCLSITICSYKLKLDELLLGGAHGDDPEDVEANSLGERAALTDSNDVTIANTESGGDVGGNVLVALLVTVVLGNVVEVLTTNDDSTVHLGRNNGTGEDTATDGDKTGEGALLVNVVAVDGLTGGLETETNVLVPTLVGLVGLSGLGGGEDVGLLLESALRLNVKLGSHCFLYFQSELIS